MMLGSQCQQIIKLKENQSVDYMELYPNPAQAYFILENASLNLQAANLQVFDQLGRQQFIQTEMLSANKIKVSGLLPGLYLVLIQSPEGQIMRKKILISAEQ
ncbi:unnamed protein product [Laminaria digitata]